MENKILKACNKCGTEKSVDDFYKMKNGCSNGRMGQCKECHKLSRNKHYHNNSSEILEKESERYYNGGRREKKLAYMREYQQRDDVAEKTKQYKRRHFAKNKAYYHASVRKRQLAQTQRTPDWLTEDHDFQIAEIYEARRLRSEITGVMHHVDHIVPLRGKKVSGLHVPWNLQVITAKENLSKSNKFEQSYA